MLCSEQKKIIPVDQNLKNASLQFGTTLYVTRSKESETVKVRFRKAENTHDPSLSPLKTT